MQHFWKRLVTLVLAFAMVFSMASVGIDARAAEVTEQTPVEPAVPATEATEPVQEAPVAEVSSEEVTVTALEIAPLSIIEGTWGGYSGGWNETTQRFDRRYYTYSWWEHMEYTVTFSDGAVVTGTGNWVEYNGYNFGIEYGNYQDYNNHYTAGNSYEEAVRIGDIEATVAITVTETPVASVQVEPISVLENYDGWTTSDWNPDTGESTEEYYAYDWISYLDYTVTFKDGTVYEADGAWVDYQGVSYNVSVKDDQFWNSTWTAGNSYTGTANIMGYLVEVPVTVEPIPFKSISVAPVTVTEDQYANEIPEWDPESGEWVSYTQIAWDSAMEYQITLLDGSVLTGTGTYVEYNGKGFWFTTTDDQGADNQWTAGNTYTVTVELMGLTAQTTVTVNASPIKAIEVAPLEMIKDTNGWYCQYEDIEYFCYDWWDYLEATVYFTDGTSTQTENRWFTYNGEDYYLNYTESQSWDNIWTAGNTYTEEVSVGKVTAQVQITVVDTPISSLVLDPISVVANNDGWNSTEYDEQTGQTTEYFLYDWWNRLSGTVVYKDGSSRDFYGNTIEYGEYDYMFNHSDSQSAESPWTEGNTYTCQLSVLGYTTQVQVTVEASPIASIDFAPISVIANYNCGVNYDYDPETGAEREYTCYWWWNEISFVATMRDGSTVEGQGTGFNYNGDYYSFGYTDTQGYGNEWTQGNTYPVTITAMGKTYATTVTVEPPLVTSIVIENISLIEGMDGYEDYEYDDETGTEIFYYRYNYQNQFNYVVTMRDGTVLTGSGNGFWYDGQHYWFNCEDTQSAANPWLAGNTYPVTVSVMGVETTVQVTIQESPVESIVIEPITLLPETNGNVNERWNEQTQSNEKFYEYYWWNSICYTVTFSDGTVVQGTGNTMEYNGQTYWFNYNHSQYSDGILEPGTTTNMTVDLLGAECQVAVTIAQSPVQSVKLGNVTMKENSGGYYGSHHDGMTGNVFQYYIYNWQNQLPYEITLTDGTVISGIGNGFWYQDHYYLFADYCRQSYDDLMLPGNTYTVTVGVLGVKAQTNVAICQASTADGYEYIVQGSSAIITDCTLEQELLQIPETLGGYTVIGITDLGYATEYAKQIIIPDSVTMLSDELMGGYYEIPLEKLTVGAGVKNISASMLYACKNLQSVEVSADNPYLTSVDGVVYDKAVTRLVYYPAGRTGTYKVPDTVTNIDILFDYAELYTGVDAEFGDNIQGYKKVDGVLYNADMTHVYGCDSTKTGSYVMPDTVTSIAYHAFEGSSLSQVTVSNNVTGIVYAAFADCKSLEKVVLPDSITEIDMLAFVNCSKLTDVELPSKLELLGPSAFANTGITSVVIPETLEIIGYCSFEYSDLESVTIPEGVVEISSSAFKDTKLKSVKIPDSVQYMGSYVFYNCQDLTSAKFGNGMNVISYYSFGNTGLTTVTIPECVEYIEGSAFRDSKLINVTFENDKIAIGASVFKGCPLTAVNLAEGVTYVGDSAFSGIAAKTVKLPESLTTISYRCFAYSENLETIDVSNSLESLCGLAFEGTAWLEKQPDGPVYLENYFYNYKGTMPASTELVIAEGTKLIADYACADQLGLVSVDIPASVESIGFRAFANCYNLETFNIAEGNTAVTYEDGILRVNGSSVWAQPVQISVTGGQMEYALGQPLGWYNVCVDYADGRYEYYYLRDEITGYDPYQPGVQTLTISLGKLSFSFQVTVETPEVTGIQITRLPNKTAYDLNQSLRTSGMVVEAIYTEGTFPVKDYTVSGYDPAQVGEQTVTVSYMDFTDTFTVTVSDDAESFTTQDEIVEISVPKNAIDTGAQLVVEEVAVEDEVTSVPEVVEQNESVVFDIFFEKNGEVVQPKEEVEVSIRVPDHMNGAGCKVFHVSDEGEATDMQARFEDGFLVFSAAHFSYYAMVQMPGVTVSGTVTAPVQGEAEVTLICDGAVVQTAWTVDGSYSFSSVAPNDYIVEAVMPGCNAATCDITVGTEAVVLDIVLYMLGDFTADGAVTNEDVVYLLWHTLFAEDYPIHGKADFTADEAVTNEDVVYLLWHTLFAEDYPLA